MEKQLRARIKKELATVNSSNAPKVFETIQAENGYKTIEDMIIRMFIKDKISINACIPQIEAML